MATPDVQSLHEAQQVVNGAYGMADAVIVPFGDGLLNKTWQVHGSRQDGLLQRLNPMFPPEMNNDFTAVTDHLRNTGWETPQLIPTKEAATYTIIGATVWRMMSFIDSDQRRPAKLSDESYHHFGDMLARFHASLKSLDYDPQYKIDEAIHFHDTAYYAERMRLALPKLVVLDSHSAAIASNMVAAVAAIPELALSDTQLIHGDPQPSNALYRGGEPFTFIDYDTIMKGPIWIDIGDLLRGLAEDAYEHEATLPIDQIRAVSEGYRQMAAPEVDTKTFFGWALTAMQKLSLELGMRFLTDLTTAPHHYFGFDPLRFDTSEQSNRHRGAVQWELYTLAEAQKGGA